jgi:hypothetical protein
MNQTASLCPYCNALLPPLSHAPTAEKLPCPRCGEAVPAARWQVDEAAHALQAGLPTIQPRGDEQPAPPGIRKTAFVVIGIMVVMALIGGSYALWTTKLRRSRDPWMPTKLEAIAFRRPLELSGLGYLPKNCQFIAGLHIAEMVNDKDVGKKLLAEPRPAFLDLALKQVTRTTGMTLEEIDHVVLGLAVDAHFPQLVMIVKARAEISLEKLAEAAAPRRPVLREGEPLYEVSLKPAGEALLWRVDTKTLVCVIRMDAPKAEHLSGLSIQPKPIDQVLPDALQKLMTDRLPKHNFLWTVGQLDQLGPAKDVLPFLLAGKADLSMMRDMKALAIGIAPVEGLTLTGNFRMNDAKSAAKFKAMLDDVKIADAASQKVEATPPDVAEQWVTWQVRGDPAMVRALLGGEGKK